MSSYNKSYRNSIESSNEKVAFNNLNIELKKIENDLSLTNALRYVQLYTIILQSILPKQPTNVLEKYDRGWGITGKENKYDTDKNIPYMTKQDKMNILNNYFGTTYRSVNDDGIDSLINDVDDILYQLRAISIIFGTVLLV